MTDKALMSNLTWRSLEMQKAAFPDMQHYVAPDDIQHLLRPTMRNGADVIHVISLAVIADNEADFLDFITQARKRKAVIFDKENNQRWESGPHSQRTGIVKAWKAARRNGAGKIGGNISAQKKEEATKAAIELIRADWPKPSNEFTTEELLERADISLNTAKKYLGKRPIAQYNYQAKLKRKARAS